MTRPERPGSTDDLFDSIATLLEPDQREYFYQRMLYFRQLRPDDELLRIVEAIGFLALIIRTAPGAVATERQHLAQHLEAHRSTMAATAGAERAYHEQLDGRLTRLPADIAAGISPPAVAQAITESLRQEFVRSGLPATAEALALLSKQFNQAVVDFQRAAGELGDAYRGSAQQATRAIEQLYRSVSEATENARWTLLRFKQAFRLDYWWSIGTLVLAALLVGMLLGFLLHHGTMDRAPYASTMPSLPAQTSFSVGPRPFATRAPLMERSGTRDGTALDHAVEREALSRRLRDGVSF